MGELRKPFRLSPGMTIGVVAPSSAIRDERLQKGIALIEARGYRVQRGDHLHTRHGYLAAMDAMRAADLTRMFCDPDVHAVFCARGGYGAWRLLPYLELAALSGEPKLFVGYSDVTTLHLALERHTGLVTQHGPVVTTLGGGMSAESEACFWDMMERSAPFGDYPAGPSVKTLHGGRAQGRLAGGCLSLLAASCGTPEQPDFQGRIVLIEDVNESVPHVDRHLSQLIRSGAFDRAAGIVVGTVTDWDKDLKQTPAVSLDEIWRDRLLPLRIPTIIGFPFGHVPDPLTIPLGCLAELDADAGRLSVLESAVL